MIILAIAKENGNLELSDYQRATMGDYISKHKGKRIRMTIELAQPESMSQRRFYHGAILPLWAYLDGKDHRNSEVIEMMHYYAKFEFNSEIFVVGGKARRMGKSSKGELSKGFIDRIIKNMIEQYGLDEKHVHENILNIQKYKYWKDAVYIHGGPDNYIDYLSEINVLSRPVV